MTVDVLLDAPIAAPPRVANVDLWSAPLDVPGDQLRSLVDSLSPEERARAARFIRARDARRFVVGRGIVREILSNYLGCRGPDVPLAFTRDGKPRLDTDGVQPYFSVTHSSARLVVAVSLESDLGVDVERVRTGLWSPRLAAAVFTGDELAQLGTRRPTSEQLFRLWTRKEAYLKGTGRGLGTPALEVAILPDDEDWRYVPVDVDGRRIGEWTIGEFRPSAGYVGSVAVAEGDWTIRPRRWIGSWWFPSFGTGEGAFSEEVV